MTTIPTYYINSDLCRTSVYIANSRSLFAIITVAQTRLKSMALGETVAHCGEKVSGCDGSTVVAAARVTDVTMMSR